MKETDFQKVLAEFAEDVNNAAKRTLGSRTIGKDLGFWAVIARLSER